MTGVKKHDFVKICRAKKFVTGRKTKANWSTEVEIEYQALIQEFNRKLVPVAEVQQQRTFMVHSMRIVIDYWWCG
jgi:hypothetical protein